MTKAEIREAILRELPIIIETDEEVRQLILRLASEHFADRRTTEDRFDRVLDELRRDREEQTRRWEEHARKWEEHTRRWEEHDRRWEEQARRWEDQDGKWDEQNRKWDENQQAINALISRLDTSIGALGARWGLSSEQAFRNGLARILTGLGWEVQNVVDYDESGEVFGRPEQIELDVVVRDGQVIICEIKSSMSRSDVYSFDRKTRFYERRHGKKAQRRLVISPMVDARAKEVAASLGIEVASHAEDVG